MHPILSQIISRIESAPIDSVPTENIYMQDLFAPDVYADILRYLPDVTAYNFLRGSENRLVLALGDDTLERLDDKDRKFWAGMCDLLAGKQLQQAIVQKFSRTVHARFGANPPEMVTVPLLYRDFPGYSIKIHPDSDTKVATMQFYLARDDSQIHLGTRFHKKVGDEFQEIKANPFKPNSAYAFARTDESWHSVKKMSDFEGNRDTLALTIYIKGQEYKQEDRHNGYV